MIEQMADGRAVLAQAWSTRLTAVETVSAGGVFLLLASTIRPNTLFKTNRAMQDVDDPLFAKEACAGGDDI